MLSSRFPLRSEMSARLSSIWNGRQNICLTLWINCWKIKTLIRNCLLLILRSKSVKGERSSFISTLDRLDTASAENQKGRMGSLQGEHPSWSTSCTPVLSPFPLSGKRHIGTEKFIFWTLPLYTASRCGGLTYTIFFPRSSGDGNNPIEGLHINQCLSCSYTGLAYKF
mgnify:CR=1 FL=1